MKGTYKVSRDAHIMIGYQLGKWIEAVGDESIKELKKKYALSPEAAQVTPRKRQRCIGEAVILLDRIIDTEGINLDNANYVNAMRYLWAAEECHKYFLDLDHARADNCIPELFDMYVKGK